MCGIVYCFCTKDTVELAYIFKSKGIPAVYYHGQLDYFEKTENARAWLSGKAPIICATSAFGMGIDKPNVRFVVHLSMPRSLEDYCQEAGRAGRDGSIAHCILMFRFEDRNKLIQLIASSTSYEYIDHMHHALNIMVSYCMTSQCRRKVIVDHFDNEPEVSCERSCDNCMKPQLPHKEYTTEAINVCQCLEEMIAVNAKVNVKKLALTFKGSKSKKDVESKGFNHIVHYGVGQNTFKNVADAVRFVQHLIVNNVLMENLRAVQDRFTTPFITLGKKATLLRNREIQIFLAL
jgi:superfamily II DNA helicase RecQ